MDRNAKIVALLVGAVVLLGVGFLTGQNSKLPGPSKTTQPQNTPDQTETIFTAQQATVLGKITAVDVDGKKITVENIFKQTGELELSDNVTVFKFDPKAKTSSPSSKLEDIRLNAEVIINLVSLNGKYYVTTIANRPPDSSIPPAPIESPQAASPASKLKKP